MDAYQPTLELATDPAGHPLATTPCSESLDFQDAPYERLCGCVSAPIPHGWEHQWRDGRKNHEATQNLLEASKGRRMVDADCEKCQGTGFPRERQSDGTAAPEPEFKNEAERRLPCMACCASSFLEDVAPILDGLFRRNGVGSVELRGGKLRFSFAHCVIGIVVSGDTPCLSSWVEKSGLLTESPIIRNFDVGDAVKTYRESCSLGEMVEEDVRVAVNHPSPKTLDNHVVEGGVS